MRPWQAYIDDVLSGERLAGRLERLAVERFCRLCEDERSYFDEEEANYYIDIISCCKHTKDELKGVEWQWMPWQYFFVAYIFGLVHKDTGLRVTRKVLLCMSKKGGKSEIAGLFEHLFTFWTPDKGGQVYSAANKYDQALYSFDAFRIITEQMAEDNPYVNDCIEGGKAVYNSRTHKEIQNRITGTNARPLAADNNTLDGNDTTLGMIDEYHAAKDNGIPDNLESGMVNRAEALLMIVTTRGFNSNGVFRQLENAYIDILEGKIENDAIFPLIFAMDEDDDWEDETNWYKSNPGLGQAPKLEGLRLMYQKAKTEGGTSIVNFKTKNLNIWTNVAAVWIQDDIWMTGSTEYKWEDLKGRPCFCGLDLASTRDLAAFSMLFPPEKPGEKYKQITRYYCPEDAIRERSKKDRVPYEQWAMDGWLIPTPGNIIDYDFITSDVYKAAAHFDLKSLYYDKHNGSKALPELIESGLQCEPFRQTAAYFNAPLKEMERQAIGNLFDQSKDPIMRWMAGNVVIKTDSNGNIKFDKEKCREKIDGMVALGMAFGAYLSWKAEEESIYEKRGIIHF